MKINPDKIILFDYRIDTKKNREIIAKKFNKILDKSKYHYSTYDYFKNYKFKISKGEYLCVLEITDVTSREVEDNIIEKIELEDGNKYVFHIMFINYNRLPEQGSDDYYYYLDLLKSYR